jgi:hypothetical protein
MSELKVTFANIVATPTDTSWSQAYTAGKLYAVLSLEGEGTTAAQLAAMGKEVINALVEEFFTLETKDLASIKTAVINTTQKIPQNLQASLVVISLVNTILYAFSYGGGKVLLKRNGKIGTVLSPKKEITDTVQAVSGFLEHGDIAMLQTKQFAQAIASDAMDSFETPTEAVEILSPKIHGSDHGGASAIILSYLTEETATPLAFEKAFEPEEEKEPLPSPLEDEVNCLIWRERDAVKNSVSMAASEYYSNKELYKKNTTEKKALLQNKGINWDKYPSFFKYGTYVKNVIVKKSVAEEGKPPCEYIRREVKEVETIPDTFEDRLKMVFEIE